MCCQRYWDGYRLLLALLATASFYQLYLLHYYAFTTNEVGHGSGPLNRTALSANEEGQGSGPVHRTEAANFTSLPAALAARASPDKVIMLSLMDMATYAMSVNFLETSIAPNNITNFLFISADANACHQMRMRGVPCFLYAQDKAGGRQSLFGTTEFNRKMNLRTYFILEALMLGYTVLHTDLDVYYFSNPFEDIVCGDSPPCDLTALWDMQSLNAGFVYVRPTTGSIAVYRHMNRTAHTTGKDDQKALNEAIHAHKGNVTAVRLSKEKYLAGGLYWEQQGRFHAENKPCDACVVAHNNWIVSMEAKIYRFREMHMWMYDDDHYYSNISARYLVYENVYDWSEKRLTEAERNAMRCALAVGHVLGRAVVLPKFHCAATTGEDKVRNCSLLDYYIISYLDAGLPGSYREHTFLTHPKVPPGVRQRPARTHAIRTRYQETLLGDKVILDNVTVWTPRDRERGASAAEIRAQYGAVRDPVLRFYALYGAVNLDESDPGLAAFLPVMDDALLKGSYRQYQAKVPYKTKAEREAEAEKKKNKIKFPSAKKEKH